MSYQCSISSTCEPKYACEGEGALQCDDGDLCTVDDICLADRKERVKALSQLFENVPDFRVALKLKILGQMTCPHLCIHI